MQDLYDWYTCSGSGPDFHSGLPVDDVLAPSHSMAAQFYAATCCSEARGSGDIDVHVKLRDAGDAGQDFKLTVKLVPRVRTRAA